MRSMKKEAKGRGNIQIGTSSLILIFTVLCMVVFSTLSLASARSEGNLAVKTESSVHDFYAADCIAEEQLNEINRTILKNAENAGNSQEFQAMMNSMGDVYDELENKITFTVKINEEQFLLISLKVFDYSMIKQEQKNFEILSWRVQNAVDYEIDVDMPVWDGEAEQ